MATEADSPELICLEKTAERKVLGCNQFDKTVFRASLGELQKVEDGPTPAPEIDKNSAKAEESGVAQYAKNELINPVIEDKVGISEGESFLESPSLAKFALQEICQASEDSGNKEKPSHEENYTLKNENKLQEDQTDESDEVTDGLKDGDKVDTLGKHVHWDVKGENVKPEDEKLAKPFELLTEEKPYESVAVTDGLTEGDKVDTSGKQVPVVKQENVKPEDEKPAKSSELYTEEKTDELVEVTDGLAEGDKVDTFGKLAPVEQNVKPEDEQPAKSSELFTEEKPNDSVAVTDGFTEDNKVGTSGKQVAVDIKEENVNPEEEQPAKSSELFSEEKTDEPVEVKDGLTEGEKVDAFGKQAPVEEEENIKPEDEQLAKSSELFTEEKNVEEHARNELFSSTIPSASAIPNLQELETLGRHDEVIEQKKQNAAEFSENKKATIEENQQRGDVMPPRLLKSSEAVDDEPILEMISVSQSIEEEKEINTLQRDETEGKKSCVDLNLQPRDNTQIPQTAKTTMGHDQEPLSATADYVEQSLKTDVATGGEYENIEDIKEKSNEQESCNKEESTDENSDIKDEPIKLDLREISFQEEELESKRQFIDNSLATASPNIQNDEAENIENDESRSDKLDTTVTMVNEETSYQKAETQESGMPEYTMTYSLEQRSQEIIENEMNDGSLLEYKIQDENSTDNIERVETRDEEVPKQSQQREESGLVELERSAKAVTEVLGTAILSSDDKAEAYQEEDRPAKNLEKSFEEERKAVQTNNCSDNRENGVQKEEHPNQVNLVDSVDKMEKEVESPNKSSDGTPTTCQLTEKIVREEGAKHEEISIIKLEEESHTNNGEEEKEPILESWEVNKNTGTANIEHDTEGTPTTKLIQTRELDSKGEVFEGLEIATASKEAGKQNIEEDVVESPFITSPGEETVHEYSQELEDNERFKEGGEGESAEKQVIEDASTLVLSTKSAGEEIVKGSSKNDNVMSYKVCEGLERNSADEEAEKQIMKDGAAADLSTVFTEKETTNESSQEDEKAKKHEEKSKEPDEASMEIFLGTDFTKETEAMASNDEEYNSHNVLNVTEATEEETIQKERAEKLANATLFMSEVYKEQVKEHILEQDENTNDNPGTACTRSTTGQTSLYMSEQDKAEEEIKHDVTVSASVTAPESEGQGIETTTDPEVTCTKTSAENNGEGEPLESSILASKEQELKLNKENETKTCESLMEDETQDEDLETPLAEQIKEEMSMQKKEPANPKEDNKMGCEDIDKENPNEECQRTEENFQNIETVNAVNKDAPEQSSQKDRSEVENLGQVSMLSEGLVTAASSMNAEENACLKEQGSLENLADSFEEEKKDDEGRYADNTSQTETQTEEAVVFPDAVTMEQNLKAVELSEKIQGTASTNQNIETDDLPISHLLVDETVNGVSETHEEVSDIKSEEKIYGEDGAPPDVEELMSETAEMSKSKETVNSDHGKTIQVMTSESIQTTEMECIELTNINKTDSKSKDTDAKDNREDAAGSKEQIAPTDLHKKGTEDGNTEERIIEEDSSMKDHNTVILRYEKIESSRENEEDQKIVKESVPELKEEDRVCKTIDAEHNKTNAIQKEEVHDEPKIITAPDDTENIKEEICDVKDISIVTIGRETINESSEEDKKGGENPGGKVPDDLEVTGPSTEREQEAIQDNCTCKDHTTLCTGENTVTQTYLGDEKQVKIHEKEVCAGHETADAGKVIGKQIMENDDTLKAHYTVSTSEETIIMHSQEDEEEKKPKIEVCERIEAATEDETHRKQSIEVDTTTGEYTDAVEEVTAKETSPQDEVSSGKKNSPKDVVRERFEPTRADQDSAQQITDDEAITGFKMMSFRKQTSTENHKENEEEAQEQGQVKESELPSTEEFEATEAIKEKDTVISEDGKDSNKNSSAFSATIALGEELIQEENSLKFSEASPAVPEEHTKEKNLQKANNANNGCPSASVTIIAEKLSLQEAEPEGGKQVKASTLASNEPSSAQMESGAGSTNLAVETMKLEETLNLDEYATKETITAGKLDAYEVEGGNMAVEVSSLDQKTKATPGTETTDMDVYHERSDKIQEFSMQTSEKQELGSIDMDSKIKDEAPSEHETQDENLETPTVSQVKEEMTTQTEEPGKLKEGVWMGLEDAMKESLLPDSDHEKYISTSEDTDEPKTAELTDFSEDRKLDNSSHCLEKNNSEGEQQPNSFPKELEKVDGCTKTENNIPEHVESNTESHDHSFKDDRNECNNVMRILADTETEDHGCDIITTSSTKSNDTLEQNLEASLIGENSKSGTESVAEDQGHAKLSITKEVGEIITDGETSSVEDQMAGQGFRNKGMESKNLDEAGPELKVEDRMINDTYQPMKNHKLVSEGIEKFPENEMVEKHTIKEENIATHLVEDETSNKEHNSDIAPVRSFEATGSIEKKEMDTLDETHLQKNPEASPVVEASSQDRIREGDFENLSEVSIFSGGKEILKEAEDNVYKTDTESVTVMAQEMNSQDAEPEGETILEASSIGFEEKRVEAFETIGTGTSMKGEKDKNMIDTISVTVMTEEMKSQDAEPEGETTLEASGICFEEKRVEACETIETGIKGEKDKSMELEMSLESQLPKFDENIDQKILTVEKLDKYNDGTTEEMQKDTWGKYEQIKNNEEVPDEERNSDEINSSHDTTENKNSTDENAEAVNLGENIDKKDIENQEKITNEVPNANSLVEEVESKSEEAPNLESEKLEKALECVSQAHPLQVTDIINKETGNKEDESMVKEHDTVIDCSVENSFQEDKKTDRQVKEAELIVEAEDQSEKTSKVNESIQEEIVTEEVSNEVETPAAIEATARKMSEAEEAVKDPYLILSEKRINECNEEDKKQGEKAKGEAAKTEPEDQIHEQEVDKIQIEKTHEAKDTISYEKVQKELENTDVNESIEQITVEEGSIRDQYLVAVREKIVQTNHQEDKRNEEIVKIAPVELKPEESNAKLESEKDQDMKTDEINLTLEKGILNKEIKEGSEGLEKAGASEKFDRPIAEEKEAFKDLHLLHGYEGKVKEIHQKADLETEKVEEEASKLNSESQNQEENGRNVSKGNEEINSSGLVVEMLELETAGSSYKMEPVTIKDDEGLSRKLDDPPNENAASEEVPREVSKELEDLSELVHEEPISEIIITNALRMETATEDTDASKGLIELEKLENASDLECSSTRKSKDVHINEEIPIMNSGPSFPTDTEQQKLPQIEGKITENEERQDLAFASKAIAEVSLTKEEREDKNKNEAPEETLKNETGAKDLICEKAKQRNMISEQEETLCNNEMMEKASEVTDEEHRTRAADSTEIIKTEISTGSEYIPTKPEDSIGQVSVEAEVEDQEPGEASRIESKVKGIECEEEKRVQDPTEEPMTDSKLSDLDNVLLSDPLQRSTKETFQIVGAEERDPLAKNDKTENKETPSMPMEEQTAGEEKDEDGEEEEDEHKIIDSGSDGPVMVEVSKDIDVKPSHKKSHNLFSGMGSKVKHSIAKVKKVITGKSSQHKQSPPK